MFTFMYPAEQSNTALVFFSIIVAGRVSNSVTDPFNVPNAVKIKMY